LTVLLFATLQSHLLPSDCMVMPPLYIHPNAYYIFPRCPVFYHCQLSKMTASLAPGIHRNTDIQASPTPSQFLTITVHHRLQNHNTPVVTYKSPFSNTFYCTEQPVSVQFVFKARSVLKFPLLPDFPDVSVHTNPRSTTQSQSDIDTPQETLNYS